MNLAQTLALYGGGPGSGCNPEVGKCGRPSLGSIDVGLSKYKSENKRLLDQAMQHWTGSGYKQIREVLADVAGSPKYSNSDQYSKTWVKSAAFVLADALNKAPDLQVSLYRGIGIEAKSVGDVEKTFKAGYTFDEPLASFTLDYGVATDFTHMGTRYGKGQYTGVIFKMQGGKGLRVNDLIDNGPLLNVEQEVISGGRFKVVSEPKWLNSGILEVPIKQLDTFDVSVK